jgi:hypothetical protein
MSNIMNIVEKLATTAGTLLGGPIIPAALEIGKEVLNLIDEVKETSNTNDIVKLDALREELEPKVMAHADATEKLLRG